MAKRYKHASSGAVVSVRDDKVLDSEWVDLDAPAAEEPAPRKRGRPAAKSAGSE